MPEQAFLSEIEAVIASYEAAIGGFAARTRQMIERYGAVDALSRLVVSADLQQGFEVLRDLGQLNQTFESLIVRYPHRFSPNVVEAAQWRLDNADQLL